MSTRPLSRVRRNICALLLALLLLSWGHFVFSFSRDYRTLEQQCHNHLQALSIGLEEHARHIVQVIDILLLEITRHYFHYSAGERQETFSDWFKHSPGLAALAVIDVDTGETIFSLNNIALPATFVASSLVTSGGNAAGLQIADKLYLGSDGRHQVAFSRQFRSEQRNLLTIIFLYTDYFLDIQPDVNLGPSGSVAIYHQQGILLARNPEGTQLVGRSFADSPLFSELLPAAPQGISQTPRSTDGIGRIVAHRKLAELPLVVTVGTSTNAVFSDWQKRLMNFLLIQVVVSLTIITSLVMLFRTLSRVDKVEIGLEEREEHFRAMANSSVDAVISVDVSERVTFWSIGAEQTFGCSSAEALNMPISCFLQFSAADNPLTLKQLAQAEPPGAKLRTLEVQGQRKNGDEFPTELSISRGTAAGKPLYTLIARDVTERRQMEERIKRLASHDNLTGLPNRTLLIDRLQVAMAQVRRQGGQFALLFVDLDKFKPVNDNYGHDIGDRLLKQVAVRMLDTVRASDTVARIGGDEFALLLSNVEEISSIDPACENLLASLRQVFNVSGIRVEISCSIGVALFDGHDSNASDLIRRADNAMYAAKHAGQNCYRFAAAKTDNPS